MLIERGIENRVFMQQRAAATPPNLPGTRASTVTGDAIGVVAAFTRNRVIYRECEGRSRLYKVVSGTVRTSKLLHDGRRQIGAFYMPADVFGLEAGSHHAFSAEAVTDVNVLVVRVGDLEKEALWLLMGHELQRAQDHLLLLAKTARQRVAAFLLEMSGRIRANRELELPMSREDIADYLGLTVETVCRVLRELEQRSVIELPKSKRVMLRNIAVLKRLNA